MLNETKRERPDIAEVYAAAQRFCEANDFPQTFLLTGPWGVGKTYLWRKILGDSIEHQRCARTKYSYCSLFGLESVSLVRDKIFSGLSDTSANRSTDPESLEAVVKNYEGVNDALSRVVMNAKEIASKGKSWFKKGITKTPSWAMRIPALASYQPLVRAATSALIRDALICIDDLERRSETLKLRDVLGLVSFLREERNCKVIVIANEDTLGEEDKKTLAELREKVFDLVVTFDPPNEYAQEIAIPADAPYRDEWIRCTNYINLTNIRILRRIFCMSQQLSGLLKGAPEETSRNSIASLVLIGARHYQPTVSLPPMDLMFMPGGGAYSTQGESKELRKKWAEFLIGYGWNSADELDHSLRQFVESGCIPEENIRQCVDRAKRLLDQGLKQSALSRPWEQFWGSFANDEADLVNAFLESHHENIGYLSPMNLDAAVRLLRELGRSVDADRLIEHYIESRKGNHGALDLKEYGFRREIRDTNLIAAFDAAFNSIPIKKDLAEVLLRMGRMNGWNVSDSVFMRSISVDQFEEVFRKVSGKDLNSVIKGALAYSGGTEEDRAVVGRATEALTRIARSSRLNRARVLRYGVNIPDAVESGAGG